MKTKNILVSLFAIFTILSLSYLWLAPSELQQAPALSLQLVDGNKLDLTSLKGKAVLITFWATTCPACIKEMPHLVDLYAELKPRGLEIIGIAMPYDRPDYVMEMVKRKKLPYPVAFDLKSEAVQSFGKVSLAPTTFLIDKQGQIVKKKIGEINMAIWKNRIISILNKQ